MRPPFEGRPRPRPPRPWPGEPVELWRSPGPAVDFRPDLRPAAERIAAIREPPIFDHRRARSIREGVAGAALAARLSPWNGLLLHGPAGNGRTTLALAIADRVRREAGGPRAAITMRMPPRPRSDAFWLALHRALRPRDPLPTGGVALRETAIVEEVRVAALDGLRLVVVDGCDALVGAPLKTMRAMLGCVAHLRDVAGIPVLMVGSTLLAAWVRCDREHVGLFECFELPPWRVDADYLRLLRDFEAALPLNWPSYLADRELALHLFALSAGLVGPLWTVLRTAAEAAIRLNYESIDVKLLDELGLVIPEDFAGFAF